MKNSFVIYALYGMAIIVTGAVCGGSWAVWQSYKLDAERAKKEQSAAFVTDTKESLTLLRDIAADNYRQKLWEIDNEETKRKLEATRR